MAACRGTIYKIGGKMYCVGEKMTKIKKGQTVRLKKRNQSRNKNKNKNKNKTKRRS